MLSRSFAAFSNSNFLAASRFGSCVLALYQSITAVDRTTARSQDIVKALPIFAFFLAESYMTPEVRQRSGIAAADRTWANH